MRIDVKKFLFVGRTKQRDSFFAEAQKAGVIEFIASETRFSSDTSDSLPILMAAHKILLSIPLSKHPQDELRDHDEAVETAQHVIDLKHKWTNLAEERRVLKMEIARVEAFGNFDPAVLTRIKAEGGRHTQFFFTKKHENYEALQCSELIPVAELHGLHYYIAFNAKPRSYEGFIEMQVDKPIGVLQEAYNLAKDRMLKIDAELHTLTKYRHALDEALLVERNISNLNMAQGFAGVAANETIFVVEGWVPEDRVARVTKVLRTRGVHGEEIKIEDKDRIPTFLDNKGYQRLGEDLVHIYDTPSVTDKDPSGWVLWAFAFFFAVIIGDGGYGMIFLLSALYFKHKCPGLEGLGKRVIKLVGVLAVFCMCWGVLTTSFFGIKVDLHNPIRDASIVQYLSEKKAEYVMGQKGDAYQEWTKKYPELKSVPQGDGFLFLAKTAKENKKGDLSYAALDSFSNDVMLEFALLFGVLHLALSCLRQIREHWAGFGWICFLFGGYFYFPSILKATSLVQYTDLMSSAQATGVGLQLLYIGLGAAVVLALIQHRLGGAGEIINVIQVFSDVLSYLRLYALGLAGGMMSATFNDIGDSLGLVFGVIVIIIGHAVNITLSIMGGVIHGLRLNFLEWYHYCFVGGGKMLKPLSLLKR